MFCIVCVFNDATKLTEKPPQVNEFPMNCGIYGVNGGSGGVGYDCQYPFFTPLINNQKIALNSPKLRGSIR